MKKQSKPANLPSHIDCFCRQTLKSGLPFRNQVVQFYANLLCDERASLPRVEFENSLRFRSRANRWAARVWTLAPTLQRDHLVIEAVDVDRVVYTAEQLRSVARDEKAARDLAFLQSLIGIE
jgi:hypothetical protein